jgi:flagellar basal body-associated protein FliL
VVNLEAPRKNTYLKLELHILFRDAELGKTAAGDKPSAENSIIRAMLLEMVSGKKLEEAMDTEAREALRLEIKDRLNEKFKPKPPKEGEKEDPKHKKPKKPIKDVLVVDWAIAQG